LPRDEDQGTGFGNEGNGVWEWGGRGLGTRRTRSGNEENKIWERGEQGLRTRRTGLGIRKTGFGGEEDGIGNEVRGKPVIEVAQTITVPKCSTRSGIVFVELQRTRILTKRNFQFYT
jgi:hypothetical protein